MDTPSKNSLTKDDFNNSGWVEIVNAEKHLRYSFISRALHKTSVSSKESGDDVKANVLSLMSQACAIMLSPTSITAPFKPIYQNFEEGTRSAIPEDFTKDEIVFFELILEEIDNHLIKGRIADLLWYCRKPKSPDHARIAIASYTSLPIDPMHWQGDFARCWERAIRLCLQINDRSTLESIESELSKAFNTIFSENTAMPLQLAELFDSTGICKDKKDIIAVKLLSIADVLKDKGDVHTSLRYYEHAANLFRQLSDVDSRVRCLTSVAECYEAQADQLTEGDSPSFMSANTFYEKAIQTFRRIPRKFRDTLDIDKKIQELRSKLSDSGEKTLGEMGIIKSPGVDISDIKKQSKQHVSKKETPEEALAYFSGLEATDYESLKKSAEDIIAENPLSSLIGSTQFSSDGRVTAKTPPIGGDGNDKDATEIILEQKIHQLFSFEMDMTVCK